MTKNSILSSLLPHNRDAAEKVMDAFRTSNRVAVVHSTGTGKSYIIAAVAENFEKPLVIAPNNFVLSETRKICPAGTEFQTYPSQLRKETFLPGRHDLIVLDEFHRAGAKRWGKGIERLLAANPGAKILGTSATHIRYLDGERNMGDELFDGNVVSFLPLRDAISRGIIPNPVYVYSAYSLSDDAAIRRARILESAKDELWKKEQLKRLRKITEDWDNANGVPRIIRKYLPRDIQRIIVFCPNTNKASQARKWLRKWFAIAGFGNLRFYNIDYKESRLDAEMEDFRKPCEKGQIKVAISVNMLNEGIHVPRVDAVMMLRTTISRIILEQQIGRCLTADNRGRVPVILDLVNNMESVRYDFRNIIATDEGNGKTDRNDSERFAFNVTDESGDIRDFFEKLDNELSLRKTRTLEECIEEGKKYETRIAFQKGSPDHYHYTINHGWADIVMAHMPKPKRWTLEEALEEAHKYDNPRSLAKANAGLYSTIIHKGWKELCFAHMTYQQKSWTLEEVKQEALKYSTHAEFDKGSPSASNWARKHGCYDEVCAHLKYDRTVWDEESVRREALKYNSRTEFLRACGGAYNYANRKGILDSVCAHMEDVKHWTLEECIGIARQYKSRFELRKGSPKVYDAIIRCKWNDECFSHMKHLRERISYTKEECIAEAQKYNKRSDFQYKSSRHYKAAKANGWLDECYSHLPSLRDTRYTREVVFAEAARYASMQEFRKANEGAYRAAGRNGWLDELTFMK